MGGSIDIAQRGWQQVIHDHDHLVTKVKCMDLPDSDQGDFSCRRAVDSSSWYSLADELKVPVQLGSIMTLSNIEGILPKGPV